MLIDNKTLISTLCKGCGLCAAICPQSAITMQHDDIGLFTPRFERSNCINCGLCAKVCPAAEEYKNHLSPRELIQTKSLLGHCEKVFVSRARNPDILQQAAAGGIITALLIWAIEKKIIDSSLVIKADDHDPFKSKAVIATQVSEILSAAGSRYLPVEVSAAIKELRNNKSLKRVAIVGLPCQINGIKLAQTLLPELQQKIALTIGLFCKQTKDLRFTDLILQKMGISKNQVKNIKYRANGWPGDVIVTFKNGEIKTHPYNAFNALWATLSCSPAFCLACSNPLADQADIAVGDAWFPKYVASGRRGSIVIIRTQKGIELIEKAAGEQIIELEEINPKEALAVQPEFIVAAKKYNYLARISALKIFYKDVRLVNTKQPLTARRRKQLEAWWVCVTRKIFSCALFRYAYKYLPDILLRAISIVCIKIWKCIYSINFKK